MGRPGRTEAPCEGCGAAGIRAKGKVCRRCEHLLELGRQEEKRQERAARRLEQFYIPPAGWGHGLPYFSHCREGGFDDVGTPDFQKAFLAVLHEVMPVVESKHGRHPQYKGGQWVDDPRQAEPLLPCRDGVSSHVLALATADLAARLREVWAAAEAVAVRAYEDGRKAGAQLLVGLAEGRYTAEQFNSLTLPSREERDEAYRRQR